MGQHRIIAFVMFMVAASLAASCPTDSHAGSKGKKNAVKQSAAELAQEVQGAGAGLAKPPADALDAVTEEIQKYFDNAGAGGDGVALIEGVLVQFASGTGSVSIPRGSKNYVDARVLAYEQAFQTALGEMAKRSGERITKQVDATLHQNTADEQVLIDACQPTANEALGRKAMHLLDSAISGALETQYNVPTEETKGSLELPLKTCKNPLLQSSISTSLNTSAMAALYGVRVVYSIIVGEEVGVILAVSPKNQDVARLLRSGAQASVPAGDPVAQIRKSFEGFSETDLLATMGTRVIRLDTDEPAIIAFGMAGSGVRETDTGPLRSERRRAAMAAADQRAEGELATFSQVSTYFEEKQKLSASFGETATVQGDAINTEQAGTAGRELMRRISSKSSLRMTGAQVIRRWSVVDPASGDRVEGVITAWSPSLKSGVVSQGATVAKGAGTPVGSGEPVKMESKTFKEDW